MFGIGLYQKLFISRKYVLRLFKMAANQKQLLRPEWKSVNRYFYKRSASNMKFIYEEKCVSLQMGTNGFATNKPGWKRQSM